MKKNKSTLLAIMLLFLSLICMFFGLSMAIFNYFGEGLTSNVVQTGRIVFSYSDANGGGNGINIENATPIPDNMGKILSRPSEYFDFSVSASTTNTNLAYEITAIKEPTSTLDEKYIKIYLTTLDGNTETETPLTSLATGIVTYNELWDTTNSLLTGKTIYYGNVNSGEIAYGKQFRLRMWVTAPDDVNFDYSEINDKEFSIKVNVAAIGSN